MLCVSGLQLAVVRVRVLLPFSLLSSFFIALEVEHSCQGVAQRCGGIVHQACLAIGDVVVGTDQQAAVVGDLA